MAVACDHMPKALNAFKKTCSLSVSLGKQQISLSLGIKLHTIAEKPENIKKVFIPLFNDRPVLDIQCQSLRTCITTDTSYTTT